MSTIITTASVRVMRSIDYGNYETALTVENLDGLTESDIAKVIQKAHDLTNESMGIYLNAKQSESRSIQGSEKKRIGSIVNDLKQLVPEKTEVVADPAEIAKVEALPLYQPKVKDIQPLKPAKKVKA